MGHIVLVADRKTTIDSLAEIIERREYELSVASNQRRALQLVRQVGPDLVIVDMTSAKLSGEKICSSLRRQTEVPIIVILREAPPQGAVPREASDWLVKPFSTRLFLGRVRRLVREEQMLRVGPVRLDLRTRHVTVNGHQPRRLTRKQFGLLRSLMSRPGEVLSRAELMREVWETTFLDDTRTLDVHVRWLRECIESDPSNPIYLRTVRGVGYRFATDGTDSTGEELPGSNSSLDPP